MAGPYLGECHRTWGLHAAGWSHIRGKSAYQGVMHRKGDPHATRERACAAVMESVLVYFPKPWESTRRRFGEQEALWMSSGHKAIPSSLPLCGISFLNINSLSLAVTGLSHCDSFTLSSLACPLSCLEKVSYSLLAVRIATDKGVAHPRWGLPWKQERLLCALSSC